MPRIPATNKQAHRLALPVGALISFLVVIFLIRAAYQYFAEAPTAHGLTDAAYVALLRLGFVAAAILCYLLLLRLRTALGKR